MSTVDTIEHGLGGAARDSGRPTSSPSTPDRADVGPRRRTATRTPGCANAKLAMWLFLSSDCLFFGAFIATYLLYRDRGGQTGPTPQDVYNIPFTSVTSFILLMS